MKKGPFRGLFGCRKSGLRHCFEVFIAPLRLRRGQGAMPRNPCYARLFADLPYTPPNPIIASGGQSRAPPVAGGARRKPSEQGSARKAPRADAARPLRTALRPPNPRGFFDRLPAAVFRRGVGLRRGSFSPPAPLPSPRPCRRPNFPPPFLRGPGGLARRGATLPAPIFLSPIGEDALI